MNKEELREKITAILRDLFKSDRELYFRVDHILSLIPNHSDIEKQLEGWEVEKVCTAGFAEAMCPICGDTGKIHRPLELEDMAFDNMELSSTYIEDDPDPCEVLILPIYTKTMGKIVRKK